MIPLGACASIALPSESCAKSYQKGPRTARWEEIPLVTSCLGAYTIHLFSLFNSAALQRYATHVLLV